MRGLILILLLFFPSFTDGHAATEIPKAYQPLIERLSRDGFQDEFLSKLFMDDRAEVIPNRMASLPDLQRKGGVVLAVSDR